MSKTLPSLLSLVRSPCFYRRRRDYWPGTTDLSKQLWFRTIDSLALDRFYPGTDGCRGLDNMTIAHLDDALAGRGGLGIVSDHDDRLIEAII